MNQDHRDDPEATGYMRVDAFQPLPCLADCFSQLCPQCGHPWNTCSCDPNEDDEYGPW